MMNRIRGFRSHRSAWLFAWALGCATVVVAVLPALGQTADEITPQRFASRHFILYTDMSADESKQVLDQLETMLGLISQYWGRRPTRVIECYVAKDVNRWPANAIPDRNGRQAIARGAGITIYASNTGATAYATAEPGVVQHEAVHAYCLNTFGTSGPVWYSEGMAELGQYWRKGEVDVQVRPGVVRYLRENDPKTLNGIVNNNEATGDSWQNYSWRWALCHLLAHNNNYRDQFRPFGLALLTGKPVTFEQAYGAMADELSFEYRFFLQHFGNGYRADLCSWDWKRRFAPLRGSRGLSAKVEAARGWQPTGITVVEGESYIYKTTGTWQTAAEAESVSADGGSDGAGRLVGVIMRDFQLGEPFELGAAGTLVAPSSGNLYVRCQEDWTRLADNKGNLTLSINRPD